MDAESRKRRRESGISLREQRWSMSSQKLEHLVAALMKPVSHFGQSFDRDDSGMLEEYLTAAGLHALAEQEAGRAPPAPNYAEVGMLLQTCANNYSRKVDLLWNMVSNFSSNLGTSNLPDSSDLEADVSGESPGLGGARRRASSGGAGAGAGAGAGFQPIALVACASARRSAGHAAPPPTLPRVYAELQPRAAAPRPERALLDYDNEPIGLLLDYHLAWRLQDGLLVEELEIGSGGGAELRPLSLMELQEACVRAAAPAPPALSPHTPPPSPPPSPPLSPLPSPVPSTTPVPPPAALKRKRRSEVRLDDLLPGTLEFDVDAEVVRRLRAWGGREFCVPKRWVRRVLQHRRDAIRAARRALPPAPSPPLEFRGFDMSWTDIGGFRGWCAAEASEARRKAAAFAGDSDDDDGFFERSSDCSRHSAPPSDTQPAPAPAPAGDLDAWRSSVVRRCDASAPLDLRALARDVRRALPPPPRALPWRALAAATRPAQPQPSRVLLDILMKASRGEVEILPGAPLSVGEFSVRVLTEERGPAPGEEPPREEP